MASVPLAVTIVRTLPAPKVFEIAPANVTLVSVNGVSALSVSAVIAPAPVITLPVTTPPRPTLSTSALAVGAVSPILIFTVVQAAELKLPSLGL